MRIGVIGYGLRATLLEHCPPGSVVAAHDPRPERVPPGVAACGSVAELLGHRLDAVFVLSPDHLHAEHATAVLEAGAAAYVEKPLALTAEDADRVLDTARRTGARLYVGHNMRHMPVVLAMRALIADGAVGAVRAVWCRHFVGHGGDFYFKDWHAERAKSGGLLLQKGAHDIDVIHWLAGGYTRRVTAMGALTVYGGLGDRGGTGYLAGHDIDAYLANWPPSAHTGLNPVVDVEDLSMATLALDNGVFATYAQCHYTPDYWRNYTVIGDAGRLENLGDGPGAEVRVWNRRHRSHGTPDHVVRVGGAEGGHGGADAAIVAEFLDHVRTGAPTLTSPVAAREAVATAVAATESVRAGGALVHVRGADEGIIAHFSLDRGSSGRAVGG
ncbi:Gfo/Idh/MocA family protein [Actinokineospora guangxiensis]|uniref:Gfo/Idh/MocA family protein n=1 Tax=Actinokineospora guangxiensis TaxID=1490288 RepID=A0ABW0ENG3_9PSEU